MEIWLQSHMVRGHTLIRRGSWVHSSRPLPRKFCVLASHRQTVLCRQIQATHAVLSANHFISSRQHIGRNRQGNLHRSLKIHNQLKLIDRFYP